MATKHSVSKILLNLIVLALIAARIYVECKSVSLTNTGESDPLLALPSDQQQQIIYEHRYEEPGAENVRFVMPYEQQAAAVQQQQHQQHEASQPRQEVYYVIDQESNQQARSEPASEPEQPCDRTQILDPNQQSESAAQNQAGGDYPAEILYIGGQGARSEEGSGSAQMEPRSETRSPGDYVEAIGQSSGLPATILSEVPVRDIPPHVLEKLKRHYGVRVVATRERPGANLVINCDDYNGHSGPICGARSAHAATTFESSPLNQPTELQQQNQQQPSSELPETYRFATEKSGTEPVGESDQDEGGVHFVEQPDGELQTVPDADAGNEERQTATEANYPHQE